MNTCASPCNRLPGIPVEYQISTYLNNIRSMARSSKKTIAIPNPVRDALCAQIADRILDYPSESAAWIGLARYQLMIGKPHPITAAIARMHQGDQDIIDDFLLELSKRGLSLRGQFLERLIINAIDGDPDPVPQEVTELLPVELLRQAREWKRSPEQVIARLERQKSGNSGI
jgi:hypothetical protein